ncbi:MAG: fibronectin, type III domain-containing protein, partial [Parcubacteria group bacterium Gr01-1014_38]
AWEFLYYDEDLPVTPLSSLPLSYYAEGPGLLVKRSNWTATATYWGIWSGPLMESHQFNDANGFLIWEGNDWLVGNASLWGSDGIDQDTKSHNNMTFGMLTTQQLCEPATAPCSLGQDKQEPNATWPQHAGQIVKLEQGQDYVYFAAQAAPAYVRDRSHGGTRFVNDYLRKFIQVADGLYLVYDRVDLIDPSRPKEWHLQSRNPLTINGRQYNFTNGSARLFGEALGPTTGVTLQQTPMISRGQVTSHRLTVTTANNRNLDYVMNVLEVGGWAVLVGQSERVIGTISYQTSQGLPNHLVTDLVPGTYNLATRDGAGVPLRTVALNTTSAGTLRFPALANERMFTLTPGAPDTTPPVISGVQASGVTATGATITWTTDEAADSQVEYGLTTTYGSSTPLNPAMVTSHSMALSGLTASTLYHYRVKSRDTSGNLATSGDFLFTTQSPGLPGLVFRSPITGERVDPLRTLPIHVLLSIPAGVPIACTSFALDGRPLTFPRDQDPFETDAAYPYPNCP